MYTEDFNPVSDSLGLTAIFAALPLISPQNLAIGAAAVGLAGQEGDLFRKVFGWSIVLMLACAESFTCNRRRCWTGWS